MAEITDSTKEDNCKMWILEAIDKLRQRKARPDILRICHMVQRKHGLSSEDIGAYLERLVDEEKVIKVDYKGSTSYRNAAKWRKTQFGNILNSDDNSKKIFNAISALTESVFDNGDESAATISGSEESESQSSGANKEPLAKGVIGTDKEKIKWVSIAAIEEWFQEVDPESKLKDVYLHHTLEREVEAGRLDKIQDAEKTCYAIMDPSNPKKIRNLLNIANREKHEKVKKNKQERHLLKMARKQLMEESGKIKKKMKKSSEGKSGDDAGRKLSKSPSPGKKAGPGRPFGKRKRFKKSLGPDFEDFRFEPSSKRPRKSSSDSNKTVTMTTPEVGAGTTNGSSSYGDTDDIPQCDFCLMTGDCNNQGVREDLLICKDCQAKAHPSCMDYSETLAKRARKSPWQCIDCKTCCICQDSEDADAMLFCDACDKGYHMDCHQPPVKEKPTGKWVCNKCQCEIGTSDEDELLAYVTQDDRKKKHHNHENGGTSFLPTPRESPVSFESNNNTRNSKCDLASPIAQFSNNTSAKVPDATHWSIEDVVDFLKGVGFSDQAEAFREQEIDGKSLLLMKRSDVLQGLSLRLGPALKIYTQVQRLQTHGKLVW